MVSRRRLNDWRQMQWVAFGLLLACATCSFAATPDTAGADPERWLRFGGRLHPLVVHFPIGLLLSAVLIEVFNVLRRKPKASPTALTCLALGVAFAGASIASGLANERFESHGAALAAAINRHQLLGIAAGVSGGAALIAGLLTVRVTKAELRAGYCFALVMTGALISVTGHLGGSLVYGDDYLTSVIWPEPAPQAPSPFTPPGQVAPSQGGGAQVSAAGVFYTPEIHAILEAHCANCHGESRQRGGLRLDQYAYLFGDDPYLWVVQPFEPEVSELVRRVKLPADDDDAMPPKGERLSAAAIGLIEEWIASGAPQSARATTVDSNELPTKEEPSGEPQSPIPSGARRAQAPRPDVDWDSIKSSDPLAAARAMSLLAERGAVAKQIFLGTEAVEVNFGLLGSEVTNEDLSLLTGLEQTLFWLNLAGTSVDDQGLKNLSDFEQLRQLHLERTGIGDAGLRHLTGLSRLEYLNLYGTRVTDAGLSTLESIPSLRELYLWNSQVSQDGVIRFMERSPEVYVHFSPLEEPSDPGPDPLQKDEP